MAEEYKDEDGSRAYTPFGVLVGDAGALKSFDDESFYNEVLLPSEKEQLKKNKEKFLKDPEAKHTVQEVSNSLKFIFWDKPVISSKGRNAMVFKRWLTSNTWSLNKEAIPDFIELLEKLRQKYSTVLGDDKLLEHLEAAQHRARELEAGADVVSEAATSSVGGRTMTDDDLQVVDWPDKEEEELESIRRRKRFEAMSEEEKRASRWTPRPNFSSRKIQSSTVTMPEEWVQNKIEEARATEAYFSIGDFVDGGTGKASYTFDVVGDRGAGLKDRVTLFFADDAAEMKAWLESHGVSNDEVYDDTEGGEYTNELGYSDPSDLDPDREHVSSQPDIDGGKLQDWYKNNIYDEDNPDRFTGSSRRIRSAAEGVDQQAYQEYIQQLVSQGIPEDQARQMADNLVNQLKQTNAKFAASVSGQQAEQAQNNRGGNMFSSLNKSGGKGMKRLIKSEGDVIVNQDDDEEKDDSEDLGTDDSSGDDSFDFGGDSGGEEDSLDFGSPGEDGEANLDEGFMDEVNSIDEFGANSPTLSKEEVVDAIQAISQIVETILETEGAGDGDNLTSDEVGYTLDEVDDLAAGYDSEGEDTAEAAPMDFGAEEPVSDEEVDEEFPEELSASLIRVIEAGTPVVSKFKRPYLSSESFGDEPALVCQGIRSSLKVSNAEPAKNAVYDTLVLSYVPAIKDTTPLKLGYMQAGSFKDWIKQSKAHRRAWRIASAKFKKILKQSPQTAREKSAVLAIASNYYDKWAKSFNKLNRLLSGKSVRNIRRVGLALQNRFTGGKSLKVIRSDYNGYRNYETWNAALYINQDAELRSKARAFIKSGSFDYDKFLQSSGLGKSATPDGVKWADSKIDRGQMMEVMRALASSINLGKGRGMGKINSNTQVDKQDEVRTVQDKTPTGIDTAGKTLSSPEIEDPNTEKVLNVDGGNTSEYVDVHNTGDDGVLEADVKAGTENSETEYGFDSQEMVGIELPIEEENNTQVLELKHIGSGVYVLNRSFTAPGAGRISFVVGNAAGRLVANNTKPSRIRANVNRVVTIKNSKNALLLKSSSVLGVIAVEAQFSKGLKNAKYSVFCRSGLNLVNEEGYRISSIKGPQRIIASAVSVKASQDGKEKRDIFSEVESAYISYLKDKIVSLAKSNADLRFRLNSSLKAFKRQEALNSQLLNNERSSAKKQVASAMKSLEDIRTQTASAEAQRLMASSNSAVSEEARLAKERQQRNIEYLSSLYL